MHAQRKDSRTFRQHVSKITAKACASWFIHRCREAVKNGLCAVRGRSRIHGAPTARTCARGLSWALSRRSGTHCATAPEDLAHAFVFGAHREMESTRTLLPAVSCRDLAVMVAPIDFLDDRLIERLFR